MGEHVLSVIELTNPRELKNPIKFSASFLFKDIPALRIVLALEWVYLDNAFAYLSITLAKFHRKNPHLNFQPLKLHRNPSSQIGLGIQALIAEQYKYGLMLERRNANPKLHRNPLLF